MIFAGIPSTRDEWPEGVLEHLGSFRQGDVVEGFPMSYLGNPDVPVHAQTAAYRDAGPGTIEFEEDFPYGMITTQTCDIIEEDSKQPSQPWVQMVPVYDGEHKHAPTTGSTKRRSYIPSNFRSFISKGGVKYILRLQDFPLDGFWVADLRLSTSVDKGWLLGRNPIKVFGSEEGRRMVGRRLAMLADRPAFDGKFERVVRRPLKRELDSLAETELGQDIYRQVVEFRIRADNNINMGQVEVWIFSDLPLSENVRRWFDEQTDKWRIRAEEEGLVLLPIQYRQLDKINAKEYRSLTVMSLRNLTPDPPWYQN